MWHKNIISAADLNITWPWFWNVNDIAASHLCSLLVTKPLFSVKGYCCHKSDTQNTGDITIEALGCTQYMKFMRKLTGNSISCEGRVAVLFSWSRHKGIVVLLLSFPQHLADLSVTVEQIQGEFCRLWQYANCS